jgi:hypothetical protein
MNPIAASKLPNVVTIYNLTFSKPDDKPLRLKTVLERVRVDTFKNNVSVNDRGPLVRYSLGLLVDPKTTLGYAIDPVGGGRVDKTYLAPWDWVSLTDGGKAGHWTLRPLDWLFVNVGSKESIGPDIAAGAKEQSFRVENRIRVINEIAPVIDKAGEIHHWRVYFD